MTTESTRATASATAAPPRVLLVHGIWNAKLWLAPLAMRLRAEGFAPELFGYASVWRDPGQAGDRLLAHLHRRPAELLVGHSLGGLVILEALRRASDLPVRRVVCMGSPLCGSAVAAAIGRRAPLSLMLGRSRGLLETGCAPWSGPAAVGVVAGNRASGIGNWFTRLDSESDGTVSVAETRLPGLVDHCVVHSSHSGMILSPDAARKTARFLHEGRFGAEPGAGAAG